MDSGYLHGRLTYNQFIEHPSGCSIELLSQLGSPEYSMSIEESLLTNRYVGLSSVLGGRSTLES